VNHETLDSLQLPNDLTKLLKNTWVEPRAPAPPKKLSAGTLLKETTAPITSLVPEHKRAFFFFKFVNELAFPDKSWRALPGDRKWHKIKEQLEDRFGLKRQKQKKRNINFGSYIAYRLEDWQKIARREHIFTRPEHAPITAHELIHPNEKLVIACFPEKRVSRIYHEVRTLQFDETMTEEERLEKLFSTSAAVPDKSRLTGRPPPGYRCHNCGSADHYRHQCDRARRMEPKGIPKKFLKKVDHVDDNVPSYMLEDGTLVKWEQ